MREGGREGIELDVRHGKRGKEMATQQHDVPCTHLCKSPCNSASVLVRNLDFRFAIAS